VPRRVSRRFACYSSCAPNIGAAFPPSSLHSHNYGGQAGHPSLSPLPRAKARLKPWAVKCAASDFAPSPPLAMSDKSRQNPTRPWRSVPERQTPSAKRPEAPTRRGFALLAPRIGV